MRNANYVFFAIDHRSTLARSGSTLQGPIGQMEQTKENCDFFLFISNYLYMFISLFLYINCQRYDGGVHVV